ncbi:hypothetical protein [Verrucomicrobium spinosum]|uniref:hypothetical protein n=1 Tax=Verrucomicrobium spinosum TaxID=2736 RepID=UPI0009465145|nr:hypothetical protein [Verrucomicrobium spinosum]
MSSAHRLRNMAPVGCAITALLTLSSCALPPKQAWQKIRHDGLFAYISYEMRTPRRPLDAPGPVKPLGPASKPIVNTPSQPRPLMAQTPEAAANSQKTSTTRPEGRGSANTLTAPPEGILTAHAVPGLPGYVRSPYTNPPRLIDVKRSTPGSTMVCPYTNKPFIIPAGAGIEPKATPETELVDRTRNAPATPEPPLARPKPSPAKTEDAKPAPLPLKDMAGPASVLPRTPFPPRTRLLAPARTRAPLLNPPQAGQPIPLRRPARLHQHRHQRQPPPHQRLRFPMAAPFKAARAM